MFEMPLEPLQPGRIAFSEHEVIKSAELRAAVFREFKNRGPFHGAVFVQRVLRKVTGLEVTVSGIITRETIAALNSADAQKLLTVFNSTQRIADAHRDQASGNNMPCEDACIFVRDEIDGVCPTYLFCAV